MIYMDSQRPDTRPARTTQLGSHMSRLLRSELFIPERCKMEQGAITNAAGSSNEVAAS